MTSFLRSLAAFFFYLLALSFFVAYILVRNGIGGVWPAYWMQTADLPLALCAVIFAGTSLYRSVRGEGRSKLLPFVIAAPLAAFFLFLVLLNFWPK